MYFAKPVNPQNSENYYKNSQSAKINSLKSPSLYGSFPLNNVRDIFRSAQSQCNFICCICSIVKNCQFLCEMRK